MKPQDIKIQDQENKKSFELTEDKIPKEFESDEILERVYNFAKSTKKDGQEFAVLGHRCCILIDSSQSIDVLEQIKSTLANTAREGSAQIIPTKENKEDKDPMCAIILRGGQSSVLIPCFSDELDSEVDSEDFAVEIQIFAIGRLLADLSNCEIKHIYTTPQC